MVLVLQLLLLLQQGELALVLSAKGRTQGLFRSELRGAVFGVFVDRELFEVHQVLFELGEVVDETLEDLRLLVGLALLQVSL